MRLLPGGEYIDIPEGWERTSFFWRLVEGGFPADSLEREPVVRRQADGSCSLDSNGWLSWKRVFERCRMLDWRDYKTMTLAERRKAR